MADKPDDKTAHPAHKPDLSAHQVHNPKADQKPDHKADSAKPSIDLGSIIKQRLDDPKFIALVEKLIGDLVNKKFGAASHDTAGQLGKLKSWVRREIDMHASGVHAADREERNP